MTFAPVIPFGGYSGWSFLARTMAAQKKAFVADAAVQRDEAYFRANIGKADTAEKLVADRRLLSVALSAYGLDADINSKYFIKKVLEDGTLKTDALANKLADKRYLEFSKAFGFGDFPIANTQKSDFPDKVLAVFEARKFETAVGAQSEDMRLALNAQRELGNLAKRSLSENAKWLTALGSAPLRSVLQTALGLPGSFASIDLDKQLDILKNYSERQLGSRDISQFTDPDKIEKLVRLFLIRSQAQSASATPSAALTLLQQADQSGDLLSRYV
jgi:hypothetical protein